MFPSSKEDYENIPYLLTSVHSTWLADGLDVKKVKVNKGKSLLRKWHMILALCSWLKSGDTTTPELVRPFVKKAKQTLADGYLIISNERAKDENKHVFICIRPFCSIVNFVSLVVCKFVVAVRRCLFAAWKCWLIIYQRVDTHPSINGFHRNHFTKEMTHGALLHITQKYTTVIIKVSTNDC